MIMIMIMILFNLFYFTGFYPLLIQIPLKFHNFPFVNFHIFYEYLQYLLNYDQYLRIFDSNFI
jgi:hypothetical protein